jgi:hypothetical protein
MRCNIIAQRMELQEHLSQRGDEINKLIDEFLANEDDAKEKLSQEYVMNELFADWLSSYKIYQPTDYFMSESREDDINLVYNIQTEFEFLMSTLELFGLPKDYANGKGHHAMWSKNGGNDDKKKGKGKKKKAKPTGAAAKLAKSIGVKTEEKEVRPTYFDLVPFQKALRKFLACN